MLPRYTSVLVAIAAIVPLSVRDVAGANSTTQSTRAPTARPAGRVEMQIDGLTVEYSPEDEVFAREFGTWLAERRVEYLKRIDDGSRAYKQLVATSKATDLRFVAEQLALDGPTQQMSDIYDAFGMKVVDLVQPALRFERTTIWRAQELSKRLKSRESVPPFTLDEHGKTSYKWNFNFQGKLFEPLPASQPTARPSQQLIIPVLLKDEDVQQDDRNIERHQRDTLRMLATVADPKSSYGPLVGQFSVMSLHEVAEAALLTHYLKGPDRRWFLDGVANYLAFERMRQKFGTQAADGMYSNIYRPEKYGQYLDRVDLEHWPTVERQDASSPQGDLLHAHYYLATETIRAAAGYQGSDLLPKLLKELKTTPRENATIADVYAAFHKVTGDDLPKLIDRTRQRLKRAADAAIAATQATTAPVTPWRRHGATGRFGTPGAMKVRLEIAFNQHHRFVRSPAPASAP